MKEPRFHKAGTEVFGIWLYAIVLAVAFSLLGSMIAGVVTALR